MTNVLILGANGFVGRRLVQVMASSQQFQPIALVHRAGRPAAPDVEVRVCDATDQAALFAAASGASYAVNCIAGDAQTMIAATNNLVALALQQKLQGIIHLSSMSVYGHATGLVDERQPLDPSGGWYGSAKVKCETLLQDAGTPAVILRPGCIYGPGSEQWTARIGRLLDAGRIGDLGPAGDGHCNLSYIDDVVNAILAALATPAAIGQGLNVSDPEPVTWNRYFFRFGQEIGAVPIRRISRRRLQIEGKLLAPALKIAEIAAARLHMPNLLPEPIPPSLIWTWSHDIVLDNRRADAVLRLPRTDLAHGIRAAAAWFRSLG